MSEYRQCLDLAARLKVMSHDPRYAPRIVLIYHDQLYRTLETFQACASCQPLITAMIQALGPLQEQCLYFQAHLSEFQQPLLQRLAWELSMTLDFSSCCDACHTSFQDQHATACLAEFQKLQSTTVHYHMHRKKGR